MGMSLAVFETQFAFKKFSLFAVWHFCRRVWSCFFTHRHLQFRRTAPILTSYSNSDTLLQFRRTAPIPEHCSNFDSAPILTPPGTCSGALRGIQHELFLAKQLLVLGHVADVANTSLLTLLAPNRWSFLLGECLGLNLNEPVLASRC